MKIINRFLLLFFLFAIGSFQIMAGTVEEQFKIEGLISPASPKALSKGLEKELSVKIVKLNLTDTSSGWPEMTMEFRLPEPSKMPAQSLRIGDQIEIEFQMQEGDIPQVIQIQPSNSGMKQSGGKQ